MMKTLSRASPAPPRIRDWSRLRLLSLKLMTAAAVAAGLYLDATLLFGGR
jgi:hypothetical protein